MEMSARTSVSSVIKDFIKSLSFAGSGSGLDYDECFDATTHGLWKTDLSWSREAGELQKSALTGQASNTLVKRAKSTIKHLRIVDKKVSELDQELTEFVKLEELTLTGNQLTSVHAQNLPPRLKVLELCYNRLISLDELGGKLHGTLEHLGVSYNLISDIKLTAGNWPSLVSLDLSYNLLSDLQGACLTLAPLSSLRQLLLMGNPLSLVPCYRSFVINSIPNLLCFDDEIIASKERGVAKGVVKLYEEKADLLKTAHLEISVLSLEGLPPLKEVSEDSDESATRFTLVVCHSFLQPFDYITLATDSEEGMCAGSVASAGAAQAQGHTVLKESIYHSDSFTPIQAEYQVTSLKELAEFLAGGVDISIFIRRLVYSKQKEETSGEQVVSKGRTSAKLQKTMSTGSKSGRGSVASRQQVSRASSRKSMTTAPDKKQQPAAKGKKKSNQSESLQYARLPSQEEGWRVDKVDEISLGAIHISLASLLERSKHCLVQDNFTLTLQQKELTDTGVFERPTEGGVEESNQTGEKEEDRLLKGSVEIHLQTITSE